MEIPPVAFILALGKAGIIVKVSVYDKASHSLPSKNKTGFAQVFVKYVYYVYVYLLTCQCHTLFMLYVVYDLHVDIITLFFMSFRL